MTSTGSLKDLEGTLQARLDRLAADAGVVGAVVAVQQGDQTVSAATGVANVRTGQPVTTDTIFQIGSISKVYTARFVLRGRLVEHCRGLSWDAALRKPLLEPLGLKDTVTLPDEAILRPVAVGHLPTGEDGAPQVAPIYHLTRALSPAGVITAPAAEVIAFARMHLNDGVAADGTQMLTPASVKAMRELQVRIPDPYTLGEGCGLGWI